VPGRHPEFVNDVLSEKSRSAPAFAPFYYGWVILGVASLAMVATLPGRTQGLGLVTESLLRDFQLDRVTFARMNLWATLGGSLFCLGVGKAVDHLGIRVVLAIVALALGTVVVVMSRAGATALLFTGLVASRGLGQSALSVVSLAMVGQWFVRRLNLAMAVYSILLSIGFMLAFPLIGGAVVAYGWRAAWAATGWCLVLPLTIVALLLVRTAPAEGDLEKQCSAESGPALHVPDFTWSQALRCPAFWVFAIASSLYNLIASGIGLFNESILAERGFPAGIYHRSLVVIALTSLAGNFFGGWLASRWRVNRLMALAMALLAAALLTLPLLTADWQVYGFAVVMGVAGGFVIVIFFSFWANAFGRKHLGRIQGSAQMMTVLASAIGPLLLAKFHEWTGNYSAVFHGLGAIVIALGICAWLLKLPAQADFRSRRASS
jgi:MFS family permease